MAEPAAASLLRIDDAEPPLPGEFLPGGVGDGRRLCHPPAHELRIALALEKPPCGVAQQLLLLGKADVHPSFIRS
jgi:hypothetical protein